MPAQVPGGSGKFLFDAFALPNPLIQLVSPFIAFTGTELYSDSARFAKNKNDGMDHSVPVLSAGNFPLGAGVNSDSIFRVQEPWKILPYGGTYRLDVLGTLITDGGKAVPYVSQVTVFTIGETIVGQTSLALGVVAADTTPGVGDGSIIIVAITGVFVDGEVVLGGVTGEATLNATPADVVTNPFVDAPSGTVTIIVTAASSGTVAFSESINDQSFLGRIWIDTQRGNPGTAFPQGTPTDPVNNFADASIIALARKFNRYHLEGTLVLAGGENTQDTDWEGNSPTQSRLELNGLSTDTNDYRRLTVFGPLLGTSTFTGVHLDTITGFKGSAHACVLENSVVLDATLDAGDEHLFVNCVSGMAATAPYLDKNSGSANVSILSYAGGIELRNVTDGVVAIDMVSGHITLAASCTGGTVICRGIAKLTDNSGAGCTVDKDGLVDNVELRKAQFDNAVTIDTVGGVSGTAFPIGTPGTPVDNEADALLIAASIGVEEFHLHSTLVLNTNYTDWVFSGVTEQLLDINGRTMAACSFVNIEVTGAISGSGTNEFRSCHLIDLSGLNGGAEGCHLENTIGIAAGATDFNLYQCWNAAPSSGFTLDMNGTTGVVKANQFFGHMQIANMTAAGSRVHIHGVGSFTAQASCTDGTLHVMGVGKITDNSVGMALQKEGFITTNASGEVVTQLHALSEMGINYNESTTTITFNVWGVRNSVTVLTATDVVVDWYNNDGTLVFQETNASPDAQGHFDFTRVQALTSGLVYYAVITVNNSAGPAIVTHIGQITIA